jgi:hypothetical protein
MIMQVRQYALYSPLPPCTLFLKRTIVALGHRLLRIVYHVLSRLQPYPRLLLILKL